MILAIDPGTTSGAAVVSLEDGAFRCWWVWSAVKGGYRLTAPAPIRGEVYAQIVGSQFAIGARVACLSQAVAALVIEGLGSRSWGPQPLIESVGELRAGLREGGATWERELRPLAVARKRGEVGWRAEVLGLGARVSAKAAEARAVEWAASRGLPRGLTRAEQGAWSEALAMAQFAAARLA